MSIKRTLVSQGAILKYAGSDSEGVCLTLCRRWIKAQMTDAWVSEETVYALTAQNILQDVLAEQAVAGKMKDHDVEGLQHSISAQRTGGGLRKFAGLRTREDVITHVLATNGAYIYVAKEKNGGGHAFAFDSRHQNRLIFFDPNQGEWEIADESQARVLNWWKEFWDASGTNGGGNVIRGKIDYKTSFHNGQRELWKYDIPP